MENVSFFNAIVIFFYYDREELSRGKKLKEVMKELCCSVKETHFSRKFLARLFLYSHQSPTHVLYEKFISPRKPLFMGKLRNVTW